MSIDGGKIARLSSMVGWSKLYDREMYSKAGQDRESRAGN